MPLQKTFWSASFGVVTDASASPELSTVRTPSRTKARFSRTDKELEIDQDLAAFVDLRESRTQAAYVFGESIALTSCHALTASAWAAPLLSAI